MKYQDWISRSYAISAVETFGKIWRETPLDPSEKRLI